MPISSSRTQKQLLAVEKHLSKKHAKLFKEFEKSKLEVSAKDFAAKLFSRASNELLQQKSNKELNEIASSCLEHFNRLLNEKVVQLVEIEKKQDSSIVLIAQNDAPFIVNTISELFRDLNLSIRYFLHPIIFLNNDRISLAFIEVEAMSPEQELIVSRLLRSALTSLHCVTNDFTSMLVRIEALAESLRRSAENSSFPLAEQHEVADFLHWLSDGGYIFLGHSVWNLENGLLSHDKESCLGLFREHVPEHGSLLSETFEDAQKLVVGDKTVFVSKLRLESSVHRRSRLNNIVILETGSKGNIQSVHSVVGLFTSKALSQESSSVPLIRRKLKLLIENEELFENSFDFKTTVNIIDSMPKDEAFRLSIEELQEIVRTIVGIQNKNETRVAIRFDGTRRGVSVLIIMPRDRFNSRVRDRLQAYLEDAFGALAGSSEYHLDLTNKPHARLYFYIPMAIGVPPPVDLLKIEQTIAELSRTWSNNLEDSLLADTELQNVSSLWHSYADAFSDEYRALYTTDDALYDIKNIEELYKSDLPFTFGLSTKVDIDYAAFTLLLYHQGKEITLSQSLPILENLDLEVVVEQSSRVTPLRSAVVTVHRFLVRSKSVAKVDHALFEHTLRNALEVLFSGNAENDALNSLIIKASLSVKEVTLLRSYCHLLWQCSSFATREMLYACLAENPDIAKALVHLFSLKFDPAKKSSIIERQVTFKREMSAFRDLLHVVSDITFDRILRSLGRLIEHTIRTNFYHAEDFFAFKIHSERLTVLPDPRPKFEIFVYSQFVEGTHLRSSEIARGGIRWSDRSEDFRSEVLGLMKTQKMKNSLIVPTGAKGGFIIRNLDGSPARIKQQVEDAYKSYIRALLSITDNNTAKGTQHPKGLLVYDAPDPYFVVAADKGTATFSDLANRIAVREFDFWLGDAFASGGSQGYDHKLYGITARGAWECVLRHFKDIGIDYEKDTFSVVGIGDMSGDVFGNGMLLSENIRLLAAFNHRHIFIDPDPNAKASFEERKKLFETPGSQWSDYSADLISAGGGVFNRLDKAIAVTAAMRAAFDIPEDIEELNGERLISFVLKTECDLLWNGGIGTYVKAATESNADVNDGTNDRVRVTASDVRAKVVGEGGNLGFTQRARIEYALQGGRINTDAIDNSAGVDLSDHEVNLKILFGSLESAGTLTREERNDLLVEISGAVVENVLRHNKNQALVLSLGVHRSTRNIAYFKSLIRELHRLEYINRELESLPDDDELASRVAGKRGLLRPELAICLAGVKMLVTEQAARSGLVNNELVLPFLISYFPKSLQERYKEEILDHPLRPNIIATQIANSLVDTMGITFVHRMGLTHSIPTSTVISSAVAAQLILGSSLVLNAIEKFDTFKQTKQFLELRQEVNAAMREATTWFFRYHRNAALAEIVHEYQSRFEDLLKNYRNNLSGDILQIFSTRLKRFSALGLDSAIAKRLASFSIIEYLLEMLWISGEVDTPTEVIIDVYDAVLSVFSIPSILEHAEQALSTDTYESQLVLTSVEDIKRSVSKVSSRLIRDRVTTAEAATENLRTLTTFERFQSLIADVLEKPATPAAITIVSRHLQQFE